jgi:cyclophilin family peptidyl-prolyl cis-trans isomerase
MRAFGFALGLAAALCIGDAVAADVAPPGPRVLIQTSLGDIVLQLDAAHAPATVANFVTYAREGHFDGTVFYRVVPGFVIQAGSWDAAQQTRAVHPPIPLEADNGLHNLRGAVAMARGDAPASATAEFFIDLADNTALDHQASDTANTTGYAVFGRVVEGMDTVDKIAAVPLGDNGPFKGAAPATPVTISRVVVLPDTAP